MKNNVNIFCILNFKYEIYMYIYYSMKKETFQTSEELIGKYINLYLWTDRQPVGKIVGIKSKTTVLVQRVEASEQKTKMEFLVGGFSAHCPTNYSQTYDFHELDEIIEVRLSKAYLRNHGIDNYPVKFYDYNF